MSSATENAVAGSRDFLFEVGMDATAALTLTARQILETLVNIEEGNAPVQTHTADQTEEQLRERAHQHRVALERVLPKKVDASDKGDSN